MISDKQQTAIEPDEISIRELIIKFGAFFKYLISNWITILLFCLTGLALGFFYAKSKKTMYSAKTTFVLEDSNAGGGGAFGQYSGLASIIGVEVGGNGGIFQGDNIFELYRSRNMVQKTLLSKLFYKGKNQLLIERYFQINGMQKSPKLKNINFDLKPRQSFNRFQDSVLGNIVGDINAKYLTVSKPDKKLSIIEVEVKSHNEDFAKDFNTQIVKTVNDFYVQTKNKKSLQNLEILQHQTDSVRNVLNGAIYQTAAVADATPNLNLTRQILRAPGQRSQFNAEANKAVLTQLVQNLEIAKITVRKETPLIQVVDGPILPLPIVGWSMAKIIFVFTFIGLFLGCMILSIRRIYKSFLNGNNKEIS